MQPTRFLLDDWHVDTQLDTVRRGDQVTKLERRTMQVLAVLASRPGELVTQEELEQRVWADVVVTTQSTYQAVAQLRRVFEDDARNPRFIATVPRKGYCLLMPLRSIEEVPVVAAPPPTAMSVAATSLPPPAPLPAPAAESASGSAPGGWSRRRVLLGSAATALLAAGAGTTWWMRRPGPTAGARPVIAVLPFADLSEEKSQTSLARALSEEVMLALGQSERLTVIARTSMAAFQADSPLELVSRQTDVGFAVVGSIRRGVDRIRVTARLMDAQRGVQIWADSFERPASDMQQIPQDVARAVVASMQREIGDQIGLPSNLPGTRDLSAYEYYLLGTQRRFGRTRLDLIDGAAYFRRAIERDPKFVAAYTGLGRCYLGEFYYSGRALKETRALVMPLVEQALKLDPDNGGAFALRGQLLLESGDFAQAEQDLRRAVVSSPNDSEAWLALGMNRHASAQLRGSLEAFANAVRIDPLNWIVQVRRGLVQIAMADSPAAIQSMERSRVLAPNHPNPVWGRGLVELGRGELRTAAQWYGQALEIDSARSDLWRGKAMLHWEIGEDEAARAALRSALTSASSSAASAGARASLALVNGQRGELALQAEVMANADPDNTFNLGDAATLLMVAGQPRAAQTLLERARKLTPRFDAMLDLWFLSWCMEFPGIALVATLRSSGDRVGAAAVEQQAVQFLDFAERNGLRSPGLYYARAALAAVRGDADGAVTGLRRAYDHRWRRIRWLRIDPLFDQVRKAPQFQALLMSLPVAPPAAGLLQR